MITIVIPTKDEEEYLPNLLESIKKQTLQPKQVIVADAGSTDGTCEISKHYGALVGEGGLPGAGRNRGAEITKTDYILFLDADVELRDPDFLEKALGEILERKLDIATCDVFPLSDAFLDHFGHKAYNNYARAWGSMFPHAPGFCTFVRKDLHDRIGGYDETITFCEDHDYAKRACKINAAYGFLTNKKIPVSIRRMDRDGRINVAIKYMLAELYTATVGPIRNDLFNYTFGHDKEEK